MPRLATWMWPIDAMNHFVASRGMCMEALVDDHGKEPF